MRRYPVPVLGCLLLLGLAAALPSPASAQGGEGVYVTQATGEPRSGGRAAGTDPEGLAGERLRENLFRAAPLAQLTAGATSGDPASIGNGNTALVQQEGSGNSADVQQTGSDNIASLAQFGVANTGLIAQHGARNLVEALQDGTGNMFEVQLIGSDNALLLAQRGERNQYVLEFAGDRLDHSVVQEGVGLRSVQIGVGTLPFTIQQQGSGMEVIIEHNPIVR